MSRVDTQHTSDKRGTLSTGAQQSSSHYDRDYWQEQYRHEPYFENGRKFDDYEPAYRLGADFRQRHPDKRFDQAESELKQEWESLKGQAKLGWEKAKLAARASWDRVERAVPGDADRDGR